MELSCPSRSLVSPERGAGAGMGVGMLRGRGIPLNENEFRSSKVSWFLGFLSSWSQSFKDSKTFKNCWKILILYYKICISFSGRY